ncbi:hypothetical protein SAGO17_0035 [Mimivirus AB-566-O17]|uniref:Bacteriophage/plasmid primase P4 C-terminal domain-containing protein n=1 Tax=Mimivirus AB-566-O17 TaxID=1988039 RepID=A0A1X9VNP7_9VIRU|nr:hypothetical protein SAGO17_0035 [Mimivirus AB-566-O17]
MTFMKKSEAKQKRQDSQIIATSTLANYFIIDNHEKLLETIKTSTIKHYYEYIPSDTHVNMFFDVEIYKNKDEDTTPGYFFTPFKIINIIKDNINSLAFLKDYHKKWIILESHNQEKQSFHIIVRITDSEGQEMYFKNVGELKLLYQLLNFGKYLSGSNDSFIIDPKVYRDGLFRTIHSSKEGQNRPLVKCDQSDEFHDIDTFVCYTRNTNLFPKINSKIKKDIQLVQKVLESELDTSTISLLKDTIQVIYHIDKDLLGEPFIDPEKLCIVIPSLIIYCPIAKRDHKSNHQYYVIDNYSIKQKCHDSDCTHQKYNERKVNSLDQTLLLKLKNYLNITPDNIHKIDSAINESTKFIQQYDQSIQNVNYNQQDNSFQTPSSDNCIINIRGKCNVCQTEHFITRNGYYMECKNCKSRAPVSGYLPLENGLVAFFTQINIQNNIIIHTEDYTNTDIVLDPEIFNGDLEFTSILCNALHGHKISKLGSVFSKLNDNFAYCDKIWYHFDGSFWIEDPEGCTISEIVMNVLTEGLNKIVNFYNNQPESQDLLKNIDSLIIKLNKPSFQNEVVVSLRKHYYINNFKTLLNSNTFLIPFNNGVYDYGFVWE